MGVERPQVSVEIEPIGRRVRVAVGTTVLAAARSVGVGLASACGGAGTCGSCRVQITGGEVTPASADERRQLGEAALAAGLRLACQAAVRTDVRVAIPPESLTTTQRLQLEGQAGDIPLDAPVAAVDVVLERPALADLRADATRLLDALAAQPAATLAAAAPHVGLPVLTGLPALLRAQDWSARVAVQRPRGEVVAIRPPASRLLGLAVDLGTTKLAAYLVDLQGGDTVGRAGAVNPQIGHGEDVMSRIAYANTGVAAHAELREAVVEAVGGLSRELCAAAGGDTEAIVDCVVVGNTAMHHLFAGLPVRQLGQAPYVAAVSDPLDLAAADLGLAFAAGARLYMPPLIAGFVGADHVAMLLATETAERSATVLALDIGTNTEISLAHRGRLWSCSTASGPAFEGAHITDGMRAAPGAIERVHYGDGRFSVQTVDECPAVGLCGSGILDAVAEGLRAGIVDARGGLARSHPLVATDGGRPRCVLVGAADSGSHRDIVFTRSDVGEIQLAKGAIRAGTELLLDAAGIDAAQLDEVVVAGAFGTYLDLRSAVRVGLLPDLPAERFRQVGNAAGAGAQQLLLSRERRLQAVELAGRAEYVELTTHPDFAEHFVMAMGFP
jgi:uncharacterized 2Fe-2S/4Fe-4S cluster protein (DUF4445 family)